MQLTRSFRRTSSGEGQEKASSASIARLVAHLRTPLYGNGYALMLNSITTSVLGVAYWVLAARNYPTTTVGLNSAAMAAMMFLAGVAQLNLANAHIRFLPGAGRKTARFVTYTYLINFGVAAVVSLVFLQGLSIWTPALGEFGSNPGLKGWFIAATITWCIFALQDSALTGMREAIWVPIKNAVFSVTKIALLIGLAGSVPEYGIFASWTIGMIITLLPFNVLIFRRIIPRHVARSASRAATLVPAQVAKYVAADYVGALFTLGSATLLPLIVTQEAGATANAYFYLSWQIATMLYFVSGNMGASLIVEAVSDPAMLGVYTHRVFVQTARILVPLATLVILGAPYMLRIFGSNYSSNASELLRLLALSALPLAISGLYVSVARVRRHMSAVVAVQAVSCVLVLVLSHFLLAHHGIVGVGVAWLGTQSAITVALLFTPELRPLWPSHRRHTGDPIGGSASDVLRDDEAVVTCIHHESDAAWSDDGAVSRGLLSYPCGRRIYAVSCGSWEAHANHGVAG